MRLSPQSTLVRVVSATAIITAGAVVGGALPASAAPSAAATSPATATPSATASPVPTPTPTVRPTATPTVRPTATPTAAPVPVPVPVPTPTPTAVPVPVPTPTPTAPPPSPVPYPVATTVNKTRGHTAYSRMAVLQGAHLTNVAQVLVGGQVAQQMTVVDDTTIRFRLPAAATFQPGVAPITLRAAANWAIVPTSLTFTYVVMNGVDREMQYAFQNWNRTSSARFGYIPDNDCANFTSQAMLARGWKQSAAWFNAGQGDWSATWVSSTAMNNWLRSRPDLVARYGYRDRDKAVVGDIVQFNYDGDAWWDHTAIVSKIVVLPNGRHDIYYAAHTYNRQFGGGTTALAQYGSKKLRIQFFHPLR